jgi:hypothetical protein
MEVTRERLERAITYVAGVMVRLDLPQLGIDSKPSLQSSKVVSLDGRADAHGLGKADGWGMHIEGAAGEMAADKAMDLYWSPTVNTFKSGGDVGHSIQVRTRSRHRYDVIVRADDRDDDTFVLVTGRPPDFRVHGTIRGRDAKRKEWWAEHGGRPGAWFGRASALRPIEPALMAA